MECLILFPGGKIFQYMSSAEIFTQSAKRQRNFN